MELEEELEKLNNSYKSILGTLEKAKADLLKDFYMKHRVTYEALSEMSDKIEYLAMELDKCSTCLSDLSEWELENKCCDYCDSK